MHTSLLQLISNHVTLSESERANCISYFESITVPKNSILEEKGKIPHYLYFVVSGFVRLFHYNSKGDEVTTHINCPPGFITSYVNFTQQKVSEESLACITDCVLLRIKKNDLDVLIQDSLAFKAFSLKVFEESLVYNENRAKELASLPAEERYIKLIQNYPKILQHVPLQYIASFLGMNPKSLSRIRKQIIW